jgi:hypothetical protein
MTLIEIESGSMLSDFYIECHLLVTMRNVDIVIVLLWRRMAVLVYD